MSSSAVEGVPHVHWLGTWHNHKTLALDLLGPSLEQLLLFCNHHFEPSTILLIARQMLHRLRYVIHVNISALIAIRRHLHRCGFVHRDVKPENFLIGLGADMDTIYLIDFGLARRYRFRHKKQGLQHIPFKCV